MSAITMEDLAAIPALSAPQFSADGQRLLFVKTRLNFEEDDYRAAICCYDLKSATEAVLIPEAAVNTVPLWCCDDQSFLFLSNRSGMRQVYRYCFEDQQIQQLTNTPQAVQELQVHPDGRSFLFTTLLPQEQAQIGWQQTAPQQGLIYATEEIFYKSNGRGLLTPDWEMKLCRQYFDQQVALVLSDVELGYGLKSSFGVAADGSSLLVERRTDKTDPYNQDTQLFDIENKLVEPVFADFMTKGIFGEPCFSPDGRYVAVIGSQKRYQTINQLTVYLYDRQTGEWTDCFADLDVHVTDFCVCDFKQHNSNPQLQWGASQQAFYCLVSEDASVALYAIDPAVKKAGPISAAAEHITDFSAASHGGRLAMIVSRPDQPGELVLLEAGQRKVLTSSLTGVSERHFASYLKRVYHNGEENLVPVMLVKPADFDARRRYPLILNIHGGPYTMHGQTFHHEIQWLAAQGYCVLLVDPRGSFGYGQRHLDGVLGRYGEGDYQDIMTALTSVLAEFTFIDKKRLYVTGGSYGGFMTNWLVTQTHQFAAAATQRSMANFVSMLGTSDIGFHFFTEENQADILEPEKLWRKSPLAYVGNVQTPMLVLHAEEDERCPMEQAEQWYTALKYLGVASRFVRFAKENHELSRTGRPSSRKRRLEELLQWFERYA